MLIATLQDPSIECLTGKHLRLLRSTALGRYIANTELLRQVGNRRFAALLRAAGPRGPAGARHLPDFVEPYVLMHSWLDGLVELSAGRAASLRRLLGARPENWSRSEWMLAEPLRDLGWLDARRAAPDPEQLAYRAMASFSAVQNQWELARLLEIVTRRAPRTVVEIGTARGGTLYALMQAAPPDALLVSIDLPGGINGGGQSSEERLLLSDLSKPAQTVKWISGDSHATATRRILLEMLQGRRIDLLFIDGDHRYAGVRADLEDYGRLVSRGGLVALHDICLATEEWGPNAGVSKLWQELNSVLQTVEIIDPHGTSRVRRGQRAWAWGIGLIKGADWEYALAGGKWDTSGAERRQPTLPRTRAARA